MFHHEINVDQYLYHFTNHTTALEYIIPTEMIRLSSIRNTNDPRESKEWLFSMSFPTLTPKDSILMDTIADFNRLIKNNTKILCLTRDNPEIYKAPYEIFGRGFSHSRMWAQYASNHKGVCFMFDRQKLTELICSQLSTKGDILHGAVKYDNIHTSDTVEAFNLKYDLVVAHGIEAVAKSHTEKYHQQLFFDKMLDWREEWEYRYVLLGKDTDNEFVNLKEALVAIIIGADFPKVYEMIINDFCKNLIIPSVKMNWYNGRPSVLPVYNTDV